MVILQLDGIIPLRTYILTGDFSYVSFSHSTFVKLFVCVKGKNKYTIDGNSKICVREKIGCDIR